MNYLCLITNSLKRIFALILLFHIGTISNGQKIAGPLIIESGIENGYTLFGPLTSKDSYLIDNCGRTINKWQSNFFPGNTIYLLPNGNLLRTRKLENAVITGGGGGGGVELLDWNSNLIWSFELNNDSLRLHHDVSPLPNGNLLMIVWELRKAGEAIAAGANPARIPASEVIWSEQIIEVKPSAPSAMEIVWKWSAWDHLIQDFDDTKSGYGMVADHPELIDINYVANVTSDWIHANSIDYNAELDQIVISSPFFNEFWIIDHSTTKQEAASHTGGKSGKGGDLLYRWGNPKTYKRGTDSDQKLFFQHDVNWVDEGPYKGKIIVFNNRKGTNHSSVEIIQPPLNSNSTYDITGGPYGPIAPELVYIDDPQDQFFSQNMSGAQALSNGNLLICSTRQGFFFEVDPISNIKFWFYKSPITSSGIVGRDYMESDPNYVNDLIFRVRKYPYDYPAFANRNTSPGEPIEGEPWAPCDLVTSVYPEITVETVKVFPNPVTDKLHISVSDSNAKLHCEVADIHNKTLLKKNGRGNLEFDMGDLPTGLYLVWINAVPYKVLKSNKIN